MSGYVIWCAVRIDTLDWPTQMKLRLQQGLLCRPILKVGRWREMTWTSVLIISEKRFLKEQIQRAENVTYAGEWIVGAHLFFRTVFHPSSYLNLCIVRFSEPCYIPLCSCSCCYEYFSHPVRNIPYDEDDPLCTPELVEVYDQYKELRDKQVENYKNFTGPVRKSTCCRALGCRRLFGRRGFFFCTEGCSDPSAGCCSKKSGDPAPPFRYKDIDDINDASIVLRKVLGDPPLNVRYHRWGWDEESKTFLVPPVIQDNESLTNRKSFRELRSLPL